jgi:hypothetical protein
MDRNTKGAAAEQEIVLAAIRLHVPVLRPIDEHGRCDLAFEVRDRLWRVQCKWGRLSPDGNVVVVRTGQSRCPPRG